MSRTVPTWAPSGDTRSACSVLSSSVSSNGLPPVATWHARQNGSSARSPRRRRTSSADAPTLNAVRTDVDDSRPLGDLVEQPLLRRGFAGAHRRGQHGRDPLDPALEVGDEAHRCPIAPMQVVEREQQRSIGRDIGRQPEQAVQDPVGDVDHRLAVVGRGEHTARWCRRPLQPPVALLAIGEERLEELPHDAERELPLEVAPPCRQHPVAAGGRPLPGVGEQLALPDPRRALDEGERGFAGQSAFKERDERLELVVPLQQRSIATRRRGGQRGATFHARRVRTAAHGRSTAPRDSAGVTTSPEWSAWAGPGRWSSDRPPFAIGITPNAGR